MRALDNMKWFIFFMWVLSIPFWVWADDPKLLSTHELEELSAYIGEQIEAEEVDCSNIGQFIEDYLKLSTANQLYLRVSANRLTLSVDQLISKGEEGAVAITTQSVDSDSYACVRGDPFGSIEGGSEDPKKDIKQDIACAVDLISENEWILSEQAEVIKEVLPTCLSSKK